MTSLTDGDGSSLPRELFNANGESFDSVLDTLRDGFDHLDNLQRRIFRDGNAQFISTHPAPRILIVAGPGSGKSYLFLDRIRYWLREDEEARIYVSSFVRKLVKDLKSDVDTKLDDEDASRVTVSTLHRLARSILERSHGPANHHRGSHINVVSEDWMKVVWSDLVAFHAGLTTTYTCNNFFMMFNTENYDVTGTWPDLFSTYESLSHFYNCVGFDDMIVLAREAVDERPALIQHSYWIVDEFQDFNASEDHFICSLTSNAAGVLIAGDDEQALYQDLKQSHPGIIISYYEGNEFANAMLPYCSRCGYWVCLAASAFIASGHPIGAINKIFLPLEVKEDEPKVHLIATPTPISEVDYIQRFVDQHRVELDVHIAKMVAGEETDPFLLILTPDKQLKLLKTGGADSALRTWLAEWSVISNSRSVDYRRVQAYCSAVGIEADNYVMRRVLFYEGLSSDQVHLLIEEALRLGCRLAEVQSNAIEDALSKCKDVSEIVDRTDLDWTEKVRMVTELIHILDESPLVSELESHPITGGIFAVEDEAEEVIETAGATAAVEMLTLVGSKGLSSKHVIVIGCDNVNFKYTSRLAFFVAMTRARKSLHLVTSLQSRGCVSAHEFLNEIPDEYCQFLTYKKTGHTLAEVRTRDNWNEQIMRWIPVKR